MENNDSYREYMLMGPHKLEYVRKSLLSGNHNTFDYLCETIFSGISTGTEIGAWEGLPHLRKEVTYPRKIGYMNISKIVKKNNSSAHLNLGNFIYTLNGHSNYFECNDIDIVMQFENSLNLEKYVFAYIYHLADIAIHSLIITPSWKSNKMQNRIAVIGGGLIGTAICELFVANGKEVTLITESNTKFFSFEEISVVSRSKYADLLDSPEMRDGKFDLVFTTTNSWKDYFLAIGLLAIDGKLSILGFPGRTEGVPNKNVLDSDSFYRKRLTLKSLPRVDYFYTINELRLEIKTIKDSFINLKKLIDDGSLSIINDAVEIVDSSKLEETYRRLSSRKSNNFSSILDWKKPEL